MPLNSVTLLTGPGSAAIAVVRLTGPGVEAFVKHRLSKPAPIGRCVHCVLADGQKTIDDVLAVQCEENLLDLNLHGGSWIVQSAIDLATRDGFTRCEPSIETTDGESPLRKRVQLSLPLARTPEAVQMLLAQPEAWEVFHKSPSTSDADLRSIISDRSGLWMLTTPRVAIVGPANVGKSTLANQLFAQARSITADLPGTTRDWVGEIANIDGLAVMLVDTPGIRATDDTIESAAIANSEFQIQAADLLIVVLDQSAELDRKVMSQFSGAMIVANKSDRPVKWDATPINAIQTVATSGIGIDKLRLEIRRHFGLEPMELNRARWWSVEQLREIQPM